MIRVLSALFLVAAAALVYHSWAGRGGGAEALVVLVHDGDTLEVETGGRRERVRLFGIDCPEKEQPFSREAREYARGRVEGRVVTLRIEDVDAYGRVVAWVVLPDGGTLNHELVGAGLAWHYTRYSHDPELARLEDEARRAGRGLWANPEAVPPWEFKHGWRR
ncbi:MAG: thermonuclease family protein [Thermodesulfobacteriota bacterium]